MGSGGSKKDSLDANYNSNRRPSQHEMTNPPTECRGQFDLIMSISIRGKLLSIRFIKYFLFSQSSLDLKTCKFCKRSFASDRIDKHKV